MEIKTAKHGTRSMYVHHGCRCDDCCRAEHAQYLKRKESLARKRTNSKWASIEYTPNQIEPCRSASITETGISLSGPDLLHTRNLYVGQK